MRKHFWGLLWSENLLRGSMAGFQGLIRTNNVLKLFYEPNTFSRSFMDLRPMVDLTHYQGYEWTKHRAYRLKTCPHYCIDWRHFNIRRNFQGPLWIRDLFKVLWATVDLFKDLIEVIIISFQWSSMERSPFLDLKWFEYLRTSKDRILLLDFR